MLKKSPTFDELLLLNLVRGRLYTFVFLSCLECDETYQISKATY